ncbi:hypothetical protein NC653_035598 [Populus alba x Populus x berolinensis]|uniref:Uncharacterized protein n=1 Tax=Populus alba x Populus x berolinensis TaxID=444605 RepID=A0AAD6LHX8_9ROSI|nr:hypothetical protein NC653_035598 [Populus alba x Populus x berolinensis]
MKPYRPIGLVKEGVLLQQGALNHTSDGSWFQLPIMSDIWAYETHGFLILS